MEYDRLVDVLQNTQRARYTIIAALTLVIMDHLFTSRQEYKFIWIRKPSFTKVFFYLNRYVILAALISDSYIAVNGGRSDTLSVLMHTCSAWYCFQAWSGYASTLIIEIVLLFRIYAMYHGNRQLLAVLGVLFVLKLGAMAYILWASCRALQAGSEPFPGVKMCYPQAAFSSTYAYWIANIGFEGILFSLSMHKAIQHIRLYHYDTADLIISHRVGEVLIRDGVMYFPFIFVTYLINLVLWIIDPVSLGQIADKAALGLRCVLTSRLLLNVSRKFHYPGPRQQHEADAYRLSSVVIRTGEEEAGAREGMEEVLGEELELEMRGVGEEERCTGEVRVGYAEDGGEDGEWTDPLGVVGHKIGVAC